MRLRAIFPALLVCCGLAVGGCGAITKPGAPDQSFNVDQDIQDLEDELKTKQVTVTGFYATKPNERLDKRNEFIGVRLTLMNIQYIKFIRRFAVDKAQLDTVADILVIGLDLAGTLVGAASTKAIIAAISGGTSASRTSINKKFFQQKTVPVLITAMNAERKKALIPILKGSGQTLEVYSFEQALSDLHIYYQAGTFLGALQAVQKDSGVKEGQADEEIKNIVKGKFEKDDAGITLRKFWKPDGNNVVVGNRDTIQAWMDATNVNVSIAFFILSADFAELRVEAVQALGL